MDKLVFQNQIKVLAEVWGSKNYSVPVVERLWIAFRSVTNEQFTEAVDIIVANRPQRLPPPLLKEIGAAVDDARLRANSFRGGGGGFMTTLEEAARKDKKTDPDFVAACQKLWRDKSEGKITKLQFDQGCAYLDSVAKQINAPEIKVVDKKSFYDPDERE